MRPLVLPLLAVALYATPVLAHPKLVSSTPAADAAVAPTNRIQVNFSEKLVAQFVGASLDMTEMPGMGSHPPMKMKVATSVGADGTSLIVTTPKPLPKGTYKLTYHVVSADTHRVEGGYSFRIQ